MIETARVTECEGVCLSILESKKLHALKVQDLNVELRALVTYSITEDKLSPALIAWVHKIVLQ